MDNILVIGNGFDLAHELNTSYVDFLQVVEILDNTRSIDITLEPYNFLSKFKNKKNEKIVRDYVFRKLGNESLDVLEPFLNLKERNFWVKYFCSLLDELGRGNTTWIDFESQMRNVIISIEDAIRSKKLFVKNGAIGGIENPKISTYLWDRNKYIQNYKDIIQVLENDLDKLIDCFEVYCEIFVNDVVRTKGITSISPDIDCLKIDKVLSFNYTQTFEYTYGKGKDIQYHYVHGKADIGHTLETNNMVLGINEYLPDDRKNSELNFVAFKKYYQRICKGTGALYKDWIRKSNRFHPYHIFIFGHSLDATDGDILRDLILNKYTVTTIYYQNEQSKRKQVRNLICVIGQDALIERTNDAARTIEFRQQQPMKLYNW